MQSFNKISLKNHKSLFADSVIGLLTNQIKNPSIESTKIFQDSKHYVVKAYPKINIALMVFPKKDSSSSLHEIASRFHLVIGELYDVISFSLYSLDALHGNLDSNAEIFREQRQLDSNIEFILQGDFDCDMESNLIYKSYKILLEVANLKQAKALLSSQVDLDNAISLAKNLATNKKAILVKVDKNIPTGSGLGGGSVNAAISLIILNSMLDLDLSVSELLTCAKALGSDVSFFVVAYLQGGDRIHDFFLCDFVESRDSKLSFCSANVFGAGEIIEPFYDDVLNLRLHCNNISCHTGKVYAMFDALHVKASCANDCYGVNLSLDSKTLLDMYSIFELNDLYKPASIIYPLESIRIELEKKYNKVFFSGSGSTFFSLALMDNNERD